MSLANSVFDVTFSKYFAWSSFEISLRLYLVRVIADSINNALSVITPQERPFSSGLVCTSLGGLGGRDSNFSTKLSVGQRRFVPNTEMILEVVSLIFLLFLHKLA